MLKKSLMYLKDMNIDISLIYILDGKYWNHNEVNVEEIIAYNATLNIIDIYENHEPKYMQTKDWLENFQLRQN